MMINPHNYVFFYSQMLKNETKNSKKTNNIIK
jgi:hypothetical protein